MVPDPASAVRAAALPPDSSGRSTAGGRPGHAGAPGVADVAAWGVGPGSDPGGASASAVSGDLPVSGDLRAALALVSGYSQTLIHLPLDEDTRERLVAGLLVATEAVARATGETLELVLAVAGRPGLQRRPVTADRLVGRLERSRVPADEFPPVRCHVDPGVPAVEVDPEWATYALRILVEHVRRHPAAAEPGVAVHARGNAGGVVLTVRSLTPGSPAVPHLRQADPGRGKGDDGHLALCRQIVEANGGTLLLDETPERCLATISLPAVRTQALVGAGRAR